MQPYISAAIMTQKKDTFFRDTTQSVWFLELVDALPFKRFIVWKFSTLPRRNKQSTDGYASLNEGDTFWEMRR
jgi:hypothetical protein